jgi:hypothetical protein
MFLQRCIVREGIALLHLLYIAFWDQLSKIGIFHGNKMQQDPQLKKVIWRHLLCFFITFSSDRHHFG